MVALLLIAVVIAVGFFVLPRLTGPKFFFVPAGEVGDALSATNRFKVKIPTDSAWFSSLRLVVESGVLEKQDDVAIEVFQGGKSVFKRIFPADMLLQSDPVRKQAFSLSLAGAAVVGSPKEAFGYGKEFEVSAKFLNSSNRHVVINAIFVDDRLLKR